MINPQIRKTTTWAEFSTRPEIRRLPLSLAKRLFESSKEEIDHINQSYHFNSSYWANFGNGGINGAGGLPMDLMQYVLPGYWMDGYSL